jgi:hypothetical protein
MAGIEARTDGPPTDHIEELSLADTAAVRALADIAGFDPYNSMERIERRKAWIREPWKAMPR